jgi:hypothetical protein
MPFLATEMYQWQRSQLSFHYTLLAIKNRLMLRQMERFRSVQLFVAEWALSFMSFPVMVIVLFL